MELAASCSDSCPSAEATSPATSFVDRSNEAPGANEEAVAGAEEEAADVVDEEDGGVVGADWRSLRVEWYWLKSCRQRRSGSAV